MICALAARRVKRPVKLVMRRPQMFGPVGCRTATKQTVSLASSSDGQLTALKNDTITHTSMMDEFTEPATTPARMLYLHAQQRDHTDPGAVGYRNAVLYAGAGRSAGHVCA